MDQLKQLASLMGQAGDFIAPSFTKSVRNTKGSIDLLKKMANKEEREKLQALSDEEKGKLFQGEIQKLKDRDKSKAEILSMTMPGVGAGVRGAAATGIASGALQGVANDEDITASAIGGGAFGTGAGLLGKAASGTAKAIGSKVSSAAEDMGMKRFGLTKLDKNNFKKDVKKSAQDFIKDEGLVGKNIEDAQSSHDLLQEEYNKIARESGVKIPFTKIESALKGKIDELTKSTLPAVKAKAQEIQTVLDGYKAQAVDGIVDIGDLASKRLEADQLVRNFGADGVSATPYKMIRDVYKTVLDDSADEAGLKSAQGLSLRDLGSKLNQYKTFIKTAAKRDPDNASILPGGLLPSVSGGSMGTIGAVTGGPIGAAAGYIGGQALNAAANNPKVIQGIAKGEKALGAALEGGMQIPGSGLMQRAGEITSARLVPSMNLEQETSNKNDEQTNNPVQGSMLTDNASTIPKTDPNATANPNELVTITNDLTGETKQVKRSELSQYGVQDAQPAQQGGLPFTSEQLMQGIIQAQLAGDAPAQKELGKMLEVVSAYEEMQGKKQAADAKANKPKALTEKQLMYATAADNAQAALELLDTGKVKTGKGNIIPGAIGKLTGSQDDAQTEFEGYLAGATSAVISALSGANVPAAEFERIKASIPQTSDEPKIAKQKLKTFIQMAKKFTDADIATMQPQSSMDAPVNFGQLQSGY